MVRLYRGMCFFSFCLMCTLYPYVAESLEPATSMPRQKYLMDFGWRFHRGDIDVSLGRDHASSYFAAKAQRGRGPAGSTYDDSRWEKVDLPHDFVVSGTFDRDAVMNQGYLPRGIGWYRRTFRLEPAESGKHLALLFEGVGTHCTIWLNGFLLYRNFCGYTGFEVDISDVASYGDSLNVLAVKVDATDIEGW